MHWRDCDAFRKANMPMNTTSNEAVKLYNCCVSQMIKWREDATYGGLGGTMKAMFDADPDFLMGHVLKCGIELIGGPLPLLTAPSPSVERLLTLAKSQSSSLNEREKLSVEGAV